MSEVEPSGDMVDVEDGARELAAISAGGPDAEGINWWLQMRRAAAGLTMAGMAFTGGALAGDHLDPVHTMVGPHEATVQLTVDHRTHFDLGMMGSAYTKSPIPSGVFNVGGIKVTVGAIPDGDGSALGAEQITQYEQFFSKDGRRSITETASSALLRHDAEYGLLGLGVLGMGAGLVLTSRRGREISSEIAHSRRVRIAAGVAAAGILASCLAVGHETPPIKNDPVLAAAGLTGVQIDGKILETLVDKYGPQAVGYIKSIDTYYSGIKSGVLRAYDQRNKEALAAHNPLAEKLASGQVEQVLWISDNHCNIGMAGVVAALANHIKPALILDNGDQTLGGTAAERQCVAVLPEEAKHIPIVVATGNHDSRDITAKQDADLGYTVLSGKDVKVAGFHIIGDSDVQRSAIGVPIHIIGSETPAQEGLRIADAACANGNEDIVMLHEPEEVAASFANVCSPLVLAGHLHVVKGPYVQRSFDGTTSYMMYDGTTGGAAANKMTLESRLGKDATITVLIFDKQTKQPLGYQIITVSPDGRTVAGELLGFSNTAKPYETTSGPTD